ncbi:hypothetical protein JYU14_00380 [Simkania negevensis]|uniref:Protochlamydia outer membrane protein domain-containing protein n=1 Tax=Simkania negevensis TaxID=83561 RepID=A0ABS3APF8_9BACT|nr:hypothetical protein [Simkania negevensis]
MKKIWTLFTAASLLLLHSVCLNGQETLGDKIKDISITNERTLLRIASPHPWHYVARFDAGYRADRIERVASAPTTLPSYGLTPAASSPFQTIRMKFPRNGVALFSTAIVAVYEDGFTIGGDGDFGWITTARDSQDTTTGFSTTNPSATTLDFRNPLTGWVGDINLYVGYELHLAKDLLFTPEVGYAYNHQTVYVHHDTNASNYTTTARYQGSWSGPWMGFSAHLPFRDNFFAEAKYRYRWGGVYWDRIVRDGRENSFTASYPTYHVEESVTSGSPKGHLIQLSTGYKFFQNWWVALTLKYHNWKAESGTINNRGFFQNSSSTTYTWLDNPQSLEEVKWSSLAATLGFRSDF